MYSPPHAPGIRRKSAARDPQFLSLFPFKFLHTFPCSCLDDVCIEYEQLSEALVLNTTMPTEASEAYVLTYTAQDSAGNQSPAVERVVVVESLCEEGEEWCFEFDKCSELQVGGGVVAILHISPARALPLQRA